MKATTFPSTLIFSLFQMERGGSAERTEAMTETDEGSLLLLLPALSGIIRDNNAAVLQECILYSSLKEAGCC